MTNPGYPDGWKIRRLGDLCGKVTDGEHITPEFVDVGRPLLSAKDITSAGVSFADIKYISETDFEKSLRRCNPEWNDILMVSRGATIGRTILNREKRQFALMGSVILLKVCSTASAAYLTYILQSTDFQRHLFAISGSSAQQAIYLRDIKRRKVCVPPLPEQQKIAAILSTWDRAIELTEKLIAAKQRRKQALMQQLLTGKVRFKEFEGKPWMRVPLGKLLKEVKRFVKWVDDAEYHLLSIRRRSGGMFDRETKIGHEIKTKVMMTTETGDFVIARMQAVHGAIAVTPPGCHGKHVSGSYSTFIMKDPSKLHMPFLNYVSQTLAFYRLLLLSAYGVTIEKMTFNLPWFLSEKIDLPPTLEEQKRIASVFVAYDEENQLLLRRLERLKQQKKGLMQQLLTGKVRVTCGVQHV